MEHRSVVRYALWFVILAEARVVVERRADRDALFELLLTLRNAIVSDGVVIVDRGIDDCLDLIIIIDLASSAGFSRIDTRSSSHLELRR
jgi:hypothetical protein